MRKLIVLSALLLSAYASAQIDVTPTEGLIIAPKPLAELTALGNKPSGLIVNSGQTLLWWDGTEYVDILGGGGGGSDDQTAAEVSFAPEGSIAATDVQAAIQEVRDEAGGGSADNLGNHTATADLDMDGNDILSPGNVPLINGASPISQFDFALGTTEDLDEADTDTNTVEFATDGPLTTDGYVDNISVTGTSTKTITLQRNGLSDLTAEFSDDGGGGGGISDGDKGSITVSGSGATWTLDDGAVETSKIADYSITTTKISPATITGAGIAGNTITSTNIQDGGIDGGADIEDASIPLIKIAPSGGSSGQVVMRVGATGVQWAPFPTDDGDLTNPASEGLDMGDFGISSLADPVNAQDAATKAYVDANAGLTASSGAFTPTLSDSDYTILFSKGTYYKIGNMMTFTLFMELQETSTADSQSFTIGGLPFAANNTISPGGERTYYFTANLEMVDEVAGSGQTAWDDATGIFLELNSGSNTMELMQGRLKTSTDVNYSAIIPLSNIRGETAVGNQQFILSASGTYITN